MCNDTIIELHDLHKSFVSSIVFLTEIQHHACALNIPICATGTTMVLPGRSTWDTTLFTNYEVVRRTN